METPLLQTKLYLPSLRTQLVQRIRLLNRLHKGRHNKLTLISAPAGFGKSTLAASWLIQADHAVGWVSLDERDNDPALFFAYLLTALNQVDESIGQLSLDLLNSPNSPHGELLITHLLNDLMQSDRLFTLALDDYHVIDNREIQTAVKFLVEHLPPNLHMVVLTRENPELSLARLRARNQLVELSETDLRFLPHETRAFMTDVMSIKLSDAEIRELESRTEGWITGLQLIALSLKDTQDRPNHIGEISGKDRYVSDYLIGEVLSVQPKEIHDFLLHTSILNRLSADLCNQITGLRNSQEILEQIEKANLFLVPLDNKREWYRYHHLFAELLRMRLRQSNPSDFIDPLYQQAIDWHLEHNLPEDAIHYALDGALYEQAADLIEENADRVYWLNRAGVVGSWLDALPDDVLEKRPQLRLAQAYDTLDKGNIAQGERYLQNLDDYFQRTRENDIEVRRITEGKVNALWASISYHRHLDGERGYQAAVRALDLLTHQHFYDRSVAAFHGAGSLLLLGDIEKANGFLAIAEGLSKQVENPLAHLFTVSNQGMSRLLAGELKEAAKLFQQVILFAKEINPRQVSTFVHAVIGQGMIHYEWNELDMALSLISEALNIIESTNHGFHSRYTYGYSSMIKLQCALGNFEQAHEIWHRGQRRIQNNQPTVPALKIMETTRMRIYLWERDVASVEQWAKRQTALLPEYPTLADEPIIFALAHYYEQIDDYKRGLSLLQRTLTLAKEQKRGNSVIGIKVWLARLYYLASDLETAVQCLHDALSLGERDGYGRTFLNGGEPIRMLLTQNRDHFVSANSGAVSNRYISHLLEAFAQNQRLAPETKPRGMGEKTAVYEKLTKRETEVLQGLASGLTYAALSKKLTISQNTLKYHIKNIYSKLRVNNKTNAIKLARELQIIA